MSYGLTRYLIREPSADGWGTRVASLSSGTVGRWFVFLLLVSAIPAAAQGSHEVAVAYADCRGIELFATARGEDVAHLVPEGFDVPDAALVIVGANRCGADGSSVGRAFWAIQVTPTDPALASSRASNYFWEPEHFVDEGTDFATALDQVHALTTVADVDVDVTAVMSSFGVLSASTTYDYSGALAGASGTAASGASLLPPFREYFPAEGGYAYLDGTFGAGSGVFGATAGPLAAGGDGPGAAFYGGSSVRGGGVFTTLDYVDAVVGFVARP